MAAAGRCTRSTGAREWRARPRRTAARPTPGHDRSARRTQEERGNRNNGQAVRGPRTPRPGRLRHGCPRPGTLRRRGSTATTAHRKPPWRVPPVTQSPAKLTTYPRRAAGSGARRPRAGCPSGRPGFPRERRPAHGLQSRSGRARAPRSSGSRRGRACSQGRARTGPHR